MSLGCWDWRPMSDADVEWLVELKARAMRPDLERLQVWEPARSRRRLLDELVLGATRVVELDGAAVCSVALVPTPKTAWLQHFYVDPRVQGRGLGGAVLRRLLDEAAVAVPVRLHVVHGSRAINLYLRHGFRHEYDDENGVDAVLVRDPSASAERG